LHFNGLIDKLKDQKRNSITVEPQSSRSKHNDEDEVKRLGKLVYKNNKTAKFDA